jgi:hypothetical protein
MKCWYRPFNTDEETPWQEGQLATSHGSVLLLKPPSKDSSFSYDFLLVKADFDFRPRSLVVHGMAATEENGLPKRDCDRNPIYVSRTFEVVFSKPRIKAK